jgi:sterol desaturase/sphingolipid hydroxylase (fatty acid hydroxylase superfamily)
MKPIRKHFDSAVRHLLYPLLAIATLAYLAYEFNGSRTSLGQHYGWYLGAVTAMLVLVEAGHALRREWRMTWPAFFRRDLPFLVLGAMTLATANWVAVSVATAHAMTPGQAWAHVPLVPGVIASILIADFFWYWVHRFSHQAQGGMGRFLWRVHVAHHLPHQVYVLMHAIGHPINLVVVRAILTVPSYLMGFSPEVVFTVTVITALQGLVSHLNVDSRVGWLNYLLVGTELHRYHHSADVADAKNFGAIVSIWDQLFGTFVYRPGEMPRALGVDEPTRYPPDTNLLAVLAYPWRGSSLNSGC